MVGGEISKRLQAGGRGDFRDILRSSRHPDRREIMQSTEKQRQYWKKNLRLTGMLLAIWFVATFVVGWFARDLQSLTFLGFPLPFYMGAQGALLIYVAVVGYYAWRMDRLDREYAAQEEER
jgi:putative solute:sodium symporter small subunit